MLYSYIERNSYQDSVNLMLLTRSMSSLEGVKRISVMMGTPANKDIFRSSGLYTESLDNASPNDICVVVDSDDPNLIDSLVIHLRDALKNQKARTASSAIPNARSWDKAMAMMPDANLAVISIAGEYAAEEADRALDRGLNVFMFSDNVSIEAEKSLKRKAQDKGLIMMGPDCGTGIISELPLAFANVIEKGNIGIVGASGTGIQEVSCLISRLGGGITHAIGIGGRDLSSAIGGVSAMTSLSALSDDPDTDVIVFISKPPAPEVRDRVVNLFRKLPKPVVAIFIGEKPAAQETNITYAWTLEETARLAVEKARTFSRKSCLNPEYIPELDAIRPNSRQRSLVGLFCGGTLAAEAAMIVRDACGFEDHGDHRDGIMLHDGGHRIIDLGDDVYTRGKPHPMIDPTVRVMMIAETAACEETAVILLDNVIGYGGHDDMAGVLAPAIRDAKDKARAQGRELIFVASTSGTEGDPQRYSDQVAKLREGGAIMLESNAEAAECAIRLIGLLDRDDCQDEAGPPEQSEKRGVADLLAARPRIVNIGLKQFAETIHQHHGRVIQFNWRPLAGGDRRLADLIARLK